MGNMFAASDTALGAIERACQYVGQAHPGFYTECPAHRDSGIMDLRCWSEGGVVQVECAEGCSREGIVAAFVRRGVPASVFEEPSPNGNGHRREGRNRNRNRHPIREDYDYDSGEQDDGVPLASVDLSEVPEPGEREWLVEGLIPKTWPALLHGSGGVAKSTLALSLAQALVDPHTSEWLGFGVRTCNVMYLDYELNLEEQARRSYQLARGKGRSSAPRGLRYSTTFGVPRGRRGNVLGKILKECKAHGAEVLIVDSVGLALQGDATDYQDVVAFFEENLAAFAGEGITVILVDHQRRAQPGERTQSLGSFGSVYKENLSRSQVQVEFVGRDRDEHTLTLRLRAKKANFSELAEPVGVRIKFGEDRVSLERVELTDADRAQEETLNSEERVLAALRAADDGEAWPADLAEATGLAHGTVKNALSALRRGGLVVNTEEMKDRARKVRLVAEQEESGEQELRL
jgi:DNA-binding MarR family transcriptional regulator